MATVGSRETTCRIVKGRSLKLEAAFESVNFNGIVLINEDNFLVTDYNARNLKIYNCKDGNRVYTSDKLESNPKSICIISNTKVAVCLSNGKIAILSVESIQNLKLVKTLNVRRKGFYFDCHSVATLNSDELIVSGIRGYSVFCWCLASIKDESVSTHDFYEEKGLESGVLPIGISCTHVAIKENKLYISCWTENSVAVGVYAFDVSNPYKPKLLYKNQEVQKPLSVMADKDCVYVCDSDHISQLTHDGELLTMHKVSSNIYAIFYDEQNGVLYTTSSDGNEITEYKVEYSHQRGIPMEILNMDESSIQLFKDALKEGHETIYSIRVMVVGHMGVGKTTLVKRLLGKQVFINERRSTEGIDLHVNCCDVSLATWKWTNRVNDSEEEYKIQRLVKLLNENYKTSVSTADLKQDVISPQNEKIEQSPRVIIADNEKKTDKCSQQNQTGSPANHQSPFTVIPTSHNQPQQQGEIKAIQSQETDPLREQFKLLKANQHKMKLYVKNYARLTMWDFAGQSAFYTTHQMFLTRRAIYLLVTDVSGQIHDFVEEECFFTTKGKTKCEVQELLGIWMNSIHSCAASENSTSADSSTSSGSVIPPPVILVGTHVDQIKKLDCQKVGLEYIKEIRSYLGDKPVVCHLVDEDFALDNSIVDSRLEDLKRKIVDVASHQPYWGEKIPTRWFVMEQRLMSLRDSGEKVISRIKVKQLNEAETVQIMDDKELDLFLRYLHETGTVIYFSVEILRDDIILNPNWLMNALKTLINARPNLPEGPAESAFQSSNPIDNGSQPDILTDSDAGSSSHWHDFQKRGILSLELVDAIWTQAMHPDLYEHKDHLLKIMEQFNIIAQPRSFSDNGIEKVNNSYLVPCMLSQESPKDVVLLDQDSNMASTSVLCCVFRGKYLPPPIFHRLIAACITRWPIAKKKGTTENLIFCGCCVFHVDPLHRLTLHIRNHIIFAKITRMEIDDVKTLDGRLCSRVRRFITLNLSKITSYLGPNLEYELSTVCPPPFRYVSEDSEILLSPPFDIWFVDEGNDPNLPINDEHMYHARLCVALITVCGKAMRDVLLKHFDPIYKDIYDAILNHKSKLTTKKGGKSILDSYQIPMVFLPGNNVGKLEQFDISLLYKLVRNVSSVDKPAGGWGQVIPPSDKSLGASMERIRSYRNIISGHSTEARISLKEFTDYWNKFESVLHDIESVIGGEEYSKALEKQRGQVISIYEAC